MKYTIVDDGDGWFVAYKRRNCLLQWSILGVFRNFDLAKAAVDVHIAQKPPKVVYKTET